MLTVYSQTTHEEVRYLLDLPSLRPCRFPEFDCSDCPISPGHVVVQYAMSGEKFCSHVVIPVLLVIDIRDEPVPLSGGADNV